MAVANLSIYYIWKNIKTEYKNNKFKISAPTWNETFDLADGSYSIDDIQDYFEFIIKKHETLTENPSIQIYPNKKNRIIFKMKNGDKLELQALETMKLLGSTKKFVDKDKNGENVTKLESVEVVLVHCNLVKNDYQHASKVLFTFVPNKKFRQLLDIFPHVFTMMNTVITEFQKKIKRKIKRKTRRNIHSTRKNTYKIITIMKLNIFYFHSHSHCHLKKKKINNCFNHNHNRNNDCFNHNDNNNNNKNNNSIV